MVDTCVKFLIVKRYLCPHSLANWLPNNLILMETKLTDWYLGTPLETTNWQTKYMSLFVLKLKTLQKISILNWKGSSVKVN